MLPQLLTLPLDISRDDLGYSRLDAKAFGEADENRLTQVFVDAMRAATQDPTAPEAIVNFAIHEKQRQNDGERKGNSRLELDICFERTGRGTRPIFKVEAKPLGPNHHLGTERLQRKTFLGQDGLGAFLSSEYASEQQDAGMLGYVQSKTIEEWVSRLAEMLGISPGDFGVTVDGTWRAQQFPDGPAFTYRTCHSRAGVASPITISHTLLDFRKSMA
ncbi:MAG TPA: hypothetical protein VFE47_26605 [Tepidisphaeraceae bacterium]|nr:hypothetical protein [Tepidisphaeraceae bacterium]